MKQLVFEKIKRKKILCVFAHPDDEAFGPAGTIIKLKNQGNSIFEIFITSGDFGIDQYKKNKTIPLQQVREKEAVNAGKILGVKKIFFLRYKDGSLCNRHYHGVAQKIIKIIKKIKPNYLLTYEWRGVSGHIDHIFTSMVTSYIARELNLPVLYYARISDGLDFKNYFIFFPPSYPIDKLDLIVDVTDVFSSKKSAIECHQSQIKDGRKIINYLSQKRKKFEGFFLKIYK